MSESFRVTIFASGTRDIGKLRHIMFFNGMGDLNYFFCIVRHVCFRQHLMSIGIIVNKPGRDVIKNIKFAVGFVFLLVSEEDFGNTYDFLFRYLVSGLETM